ncbi:COX15/CtaA family protein [Allostreptomyces psammosilenae]|uniref:Cytochrome c oxidase assembly protein subunit 15 n=1 Tax=Allostreptomyces psammosilenae TaxID=1892865 RepID=A0A853A307_9ACTN|nr:COX15/CtaA family protein [Allostreptomyces psammosilenae]NYI07254.1 cytochrome c oxidase assembly protein subunit 15 [Allostreptomyces psammosilenae]
MRTPLALIAERFHASPALVRRTALATIWINVLVAVTGGAVRLTESGLGCSTWPQCVPGSLTPTPEMGIHGVIEFGNRLLTYVVCAAIGAAIIAARSARPWRRDLTRLGWAQFWLVMGNAVVGGMVVLTGLNPYIVGSHFLLSIGLIAVATVMWQRSREEPAPARPVVPTAVRQLALTLVGAVGALVVVGVLVTGTGPHAGDAREVERIPLNWDQVTQLHVDLVYLSLGLTVALYFALRAVDAPRAARARVRDLLVVMLAQGVVGYVQYFTHLPEIVVGTHILGACLVWAAAVRVPLALRERVPAPGASPADPAAPAGRGEAEEPAEGAGEAVPADRPAEAVAS